MDAEAEVMPEVKIPSERRSRAWTARCCTLCVWGRAARWLVMAAILFDFVALLVLVAVFILTTISGFHMSQGYRNISANATYFENIFMELGSALKKLPKHNITLSQAQREQSRAAAVRRCLRSVITVAPGGRFAEAFMAWASVWAVARLHGVPMATPTQLRDALHRAFSRVPTGPTVDALLRECPYGSGLEEAEAIRVLLEDIYRNADAFAARANTSAAWKVPGPVAFPNHVTFASYIARVSDELLGLVEWQESLRAQAQSALRDIGVLVAKKFGDPPDKVVYVGMHVRRTDFPSFIKSDLHSDVEAGVDYYLHAVRYLSRKLEADGGWRGRGRGRGRSEDGGIGGGGGEGGGGDGGVGPLAVVVSSEDMPWVRDVLLPALDNMTRVAGLRLASFAGGGGTNETVLQDLALLSACNHTIISYGSFGMTAALLSGGEVVAFEITSSYATAIFARRLPNWNLLR